MYLYIQVGIKNVQITKTRKEKIATFVKLCRMPL